jgi:uncharacterized protein YqjF (DUF2071 family)
MLNYRVDPALLAPHLPAGTVLDERAGSHFVSVVGFRFLRTRVLGVPIPLHRDFEEVNLRFYVRREVCGDVRRGVVFIRELVPRAAIAMVARAAYEEPYLALPMRHRISWRAGTTDPTLVEYGWRSRRGWSRLAVVPRGTASPVVRGSDEEFIVEHYWGYTRRRHGGSAEYRVEHPPWRCWTVSDASLEGPLADVYPDAFAALLASPPHSAFLAEGSEVRVFHPTRFPAPSASGSRDAEPGA